MRRLVLLITVVLTTEIAIYGQGEAAVPFLVLQQSPLLHGAGQIGTAVKTKDASGFYYNPAQLGNLQGGSSLSLFFYATKN